MKMLSLQPLNSKAMVGTQKRILQKSAQQENAVACSWPCGQALITDYKSTRVKLASFGLEVAE
jgi:hypothetical protein